MDWVITALCTALGTLAGGGGIGWAFHIKASRKQAEAEARIKDAEARLANAEIDNKVAEGYKELAREKQARIEKLDHENDRLNAKIDELYSELTTEREARFAAVEELSRVRMLECTRLGCVDRDPPFGSAPCLREYLEKKGLKGAE